MSRRVATLAAMLFLAGCSFPGTVQARAFTTGFKAGETILYRIHTTSSGTLQLGSQQIPVSSDHTLTEVLKAVSVDRTGTATVMVTTEDITEPPSQPPAPVTLQIGSDGRIKSGGAVQLSGRVPALPGTDQLTPVLPGHSVKPGDAWTSQYSRPNPYGAGGFSFTARNRYVADEVVGAHTAAMIDTALQGPVDFSIDFSRVPGAVPAPPVAAPVHYTGSTNSSRRYWVDLDSHQVLKSTGSGSYRLTYAVTVTAGQASGPQQVDFNGEIKTDLARL